MRDRSRLGMVVLVLFTWVSIVIPVGVLRAEESAPEQQAQVEKRSPEENQQMMQQMMAGMMGQMMEGLARSMAKPEFAKNMATFMRNYYRALIEQGFSPEEAMKIVTSSGIPNLGGKQ